MKVVHAKINNYLKYFSTEWEYMVRESVNNKK